MKRYVLRMSFKKLKTIGEKNQKLIKKQKRAAKRAALILEKQKIRAAKRAARKSLTLSKIKKELGNKFNLADLQKLIKREESSTPSSKVSFNKFYIINRQYRKLRKAIEKTEANILTSKKKKGILLLTREYLVNKISTFINRWYNKGIILISLRGIRLRNEITAVRYYRNLVSVLS